MVVFSVYGQACPINFNFDTKADRKMIKLISKVKTLFIITAQ